MNKEIKNLLSKYAQILRQVNCPIYTALLSNFSWYDWLLWLYIKTYGENYKP